ncbi:Pr6Pr family membrane protein [Spiroplasma platyhelix]|uniref:Pr6Pr family membrane protein n=1 Tax=Spiroplasma platyhelix PALS-1 TaxID=1276218 RepID=A0A846TZU1_9MOLU|nr:Pr6Pr family membrane protein [Spiroplasma platyhelix]MBE4703921.1 hypothetical protein [Spiroplasma platyhelix PALS-1]NKE38294.1 Pr6Pr family membrane protein [Spiroplasma platyhelix PALS-1]UJB29179.1 hypothetical protein SPLAT_v1c04150 [Spiroplasma platyhelix PALS-1]
MNFKISRRASFYIYLSALLMLFLFLVIDLIMAIYFPIGVAKQLGAGERVSHYYSFFTTQSNYLVAIYFAMVLYYSHFKRILPIFQVRLAVTVYITITMIIFWVGLFNQVQDIDKYDVYHWINTMILHLVMPIIMIINFVMTSGKERIAIKKWHQNYLWLIGLYPAIYSIVILIRGHLRYLDSKPEDTWYPYFFFNIDQPYGWLIATAAIIIIFGLVFGLQYFYISINNLMFDRNQKQRKRLETYYAKTLAKLRNRPIKKNKS